MCTHVYIYIHVYSNPRYYLFIIMTRLMHPFTIIILCHVLVWSDGKLVASSIINLSYIRAIMSVHATRVFIIIGKTIVRQKRFIYMHCASVKAGDNNMLQCSIIMHEHVYIYH